MPPSISPMRPLPIGDTGAVERELDAVVFSGHKLYAPGSPGRGGGAAGAAGGLEPDELGGGMVDDVSLNSYQITARIPRPGGSRYA